MQVFVLASGPGFAHRNPQDDFGKDLMDWALSWLIMMHSKTYAILFVVNLKYNNPTTPAYKQSFTLIPVKQMYIINH